MKLHLPKRLFMAVLAACVIPAAYADTPIYSGTIYTFKGHTSETTELAYSILEYNTGEGTATIQGNSASWVDIKNAIATPSADRHTLKLGAGHAESITYTFNPIAVAGFIVEASGYSIEPGSTTGKRNIDIGNTNSTAAYSTINHNFSLNNNSRTDATITLYGTQTWTIADTATFTLNAGSAASIVLASGSLTTQTGGTVDFSGDSVTGSGNYTVGSGKLQNATFTSGTTLGIGASTASFENVTLQSGANLDLTQRTLSSDTAAVSGGVTLNSGINVYLSNIEEGTEVKLFDQSVENVTLFVDGKLVSSGRSEITESGGSYSFVKLGFVLSDLVWAGGESDTWNTTNTNWNSETGGQGIAFANGDSVSFTSTSAVDVAEGVTVGGMTVSGAETVLSMTRSDSGYIAGNVTVSDGATLIIGTKTDGAGFIRGNIDVVDGTLQFNAQDVTGYNGGVNSTQSIMIAAGSQLVLNHSANETFAGSLVLNGTVKGIGEEAAQWDFYGNSAKLKVEANQTATFENVTIRLRQNNTQIDVASGATLTTADVIDGGDYGNGKFIKNGVGDLIVDGNINVNGISMKGGSATLKGGGSVGAVGLNADYTTLTFAAKEGAETTVYTAGEIKTNLDGTGGTRYNSSIIINESVTVNAASFANSWGLKSLTVDGELNVTGQLAFSTGGNTGETNYINGSGSVKAGSFTAGNAGTLYTLNVDNFTVETTSTIGINTKILEGTVDLAAVTLTANLQVEGGTVTLASTNSGGNKNGTLTVKGGEVNLSGENSSVHNIGTLDTSVGGDSYGVLNIEAGATANVTTLWGCSTATINLEEGAQLNLGVINIKGTANSTSVQASGNAAYSANSEVYSITDAVVTVASENDTTVGNKLTNAYLVNSGSGSVTATNSGNILTGIDASAGSISATVAEQTQSLAELKIAASMRVDIMYSTDAPANVELNGAATIGSGATLMANLTLAKGAEVEMVDALNLDGGSLTLQEGITLNGDILNSIKSLSGDNRIDLFTGVSSLTLGEAVAVLTADSTTTTSYTAANAIDLNTYFTNLDAGKYYLGYEQGLVYAGSFASIPEPTTATLSLLALAALAARRRRR